MAIENELSETTQPRSRIGWLKSIGCGVLILALLVAVGVFWKHGKTASKLQETLAELDRTEPGWRLEEIEAAREDMPEEENSARVVAAAVGRMPRLWPSQGFPDDHFRSLPPNETLSGEDYVRLTKELASVRAALMVAGKLANMPRGRHPIQIERNPITTRLPHLQECRKLVTLLVYEAMRRSQRGDSKNALTACRAALNAGRSIDNEPFYISQLVRIACVVQICQAVERTLGQCEPPPEDMSVLQKMLEEEDAFPGLLNATRGERATMNKLFEAVERGEVSLKELERDAGNASRPPDWLQSTFTSLWRMDTQEDHALYLSLMTSRVREVQRAMPEQAALEKEFEQEVRALPKNATISRLLLPAVSKVGEASRRKHVLLRCTIAALAAERWRRDKKTWPDNLDQLCPQFLSAVPLDPLDGRPLRFKRVKDGVVIYSVGQDGVDNGGHLDRGHQAFPPGAGVDIGFRLWDVPKRRQPSKPRNEDKLR